MRIIIIFCVQQARLYFDITFLQMIYDLSFTKWCTCFIIIKMKQNFRMYILMACNIFLPRKFKVGSTFQYFNIIKWYDFSFKNVVLSLITSSRIKQLHDERNQDIQFYLLYSKKIMKCKRFQLKLYWLLD